MKKFIVFDLDGTLINTAQGITVAVNNTLEHFNYGYKYSEDDVIKMIGNGAKLLFARATKKEVIDIDEYAYFQIEYVKTQNVSEVYEEVIETLRVLENCGFNLLIYSNKPNGALQYLIKEKMNDITWIAIQGNEAGFPPKPDVTVLNKILSKYYSADDEGYYVGDSYVDCETAKNAELKSIIVTYGYGNYATIDEYHPDYKISHFSELLDIVR